MKSSYFESIYKIPFTNKQIYGCQLFIYLFKMIEQQKVFALLEQYNHMKAGLTLPIKMRLYFQTLESLLNKQNTNYSKQQILDPVFITTFQKLNELEKVFYLHKMMTHLNFTLKSINNHEVKIYQSVEENLEKAINNIQTSCKIEVINFGISSWSRAKIKLDKFGRRVDITSKHKNIVLNLEQYLIRNSKKHKSTIVFEAVSKRVSPDNSRVCIYFLESIFKELQRELFETVMDAHKSKLTQMQSLSNQSQHKKKTDQSLVFLNSQALTNFLKYKALVLERISTENLNFKAIFQKQYSNGTRVEIGRSQKVNKIYKVQFYSQLNLTDLKAAISQAYLKKFKYRVQKSLVQQFSKKYHAVYERYIFNGQVFDQINIQQQGIQQKDQILFSKGIDNVLTSNMLEFVLIKINRLQNCTQCKVYVSLGTPKQLAAQIPINFMLQFYQMIDRDQQDQAQLEKTNLQQFFTIISDQNSQISIQIQIQHEGNSLRSTAANQITSPQKDTWINKNICRLQIQPLLLTQSELKMKIIKQHFMLKEWKRSKSGGFVCVDLQLIAEQKKMIKKIIASIGNNIFKIFRNGAGVINMCLPVVIFKKQSHLQTIARNLSYAPLFLESSQNQQFLQRFKNCILFVISNCTLGISLKKPFNPILGETYQGWIGGCPVYLQQISHHPPISSYYFKGRGYTIHGSLQPKVTFNGLNGGKCWSEKPNYIQFEDGSKICFINARMLIKNLIIGERQFHFTDKIYVYDMKNNYFAQLNFGPKKKGFFTTNTQPQDFIHGNIYRTTTAFLPKFKSNPGIFPSVQDIAKQICSIEGIWNEKIMFNGKVYVDLNEFLPYQLENQENPLPSNCNFRNDIISILKNQMDKAQDQKQKLQQIQRNDKKLRENRKK